MYWLIVRLKEDGYLTLFIVLLVILLIERILVILKTCFIFLLGNELWATPVSIITNLLGCDISLGYDDLNDDDLLFFNNQFSR